MIGLLSPRLGAVELVEMGRAARNDARSSNSRRSPVAHGPARMGDVFGDVFGFLFGLVGNGISALTSILKVPLNLVGEGVGFLITNLADLMRNIPVIGDLVATILLAANALIQFAISIPVTILDAIGNLGKAFAGLTSGQQSAATQKAIEQIEKSAPPEMKGQVSETLKKTPPPGGSAGDGFPVVPVLVGTGLVGAAVAAATLL